MRTSEEGPAAACGPTPLIPDGGTLGARAALEEGAAPVEDDIGGGSSGCSIGIVEGPAKRWPDSEDRWDGRLGPASADWPGESTVGRGIGGKLETRRLLGESGGPRV